MLVWSEKKKSRVKELRNFFFYLTFNINLTKGILQVKSKWRTTTTTTRDSQFNLIFISSCWLTLKSFDIPNINEYTRVIQLSHSNSNSSVQCLSFTRFFFQSFLNPCTRISSWKLSKHFHLFFYLIYPFISSFYIIFYFH